MLKLLLSTLEKDDVDSYITYNLRYEKNTKSVPEKKACISNVLKVDAGNIEALKLRLQLQWQAADAKSLTQSFEQILTYSHNPQKEVVDMLSFLGRNLETAGHAGFVRHVLRYYAGELRELQDTLLTIAERMLENGFFEDAQYLLSLVLSFDPQSKAAYWMVCRVKTARSVCF